MPKSAEAIVKLFRRLPDLTASDPEWQLVSRHWNGRLSLAAGPDRAAFTATAAAFDVVDSCLRPSTRHVWATPEMSRRLAEEIPGATLQVMTGLGHFPMSEDPAKFLSYVQPILDAIAQSSTVTA
jgi:pimeloyl-ACP methyl ester carboxylesterase